MKILDRSFSIFFVHLGHHPEQWPEEVHAAGSTCDRLVRHVHETSSYQE